MLLMKIKNFLRLLVYRTKINRIQLKLPLILSSILIGFIFFYFVFQLFASIPLKKIDYSQYIIKYSNKQINHFQKKVLNQHWKNLHTSLYTVQLGDNFWKIAKTNHIDIDTIVGVNPYLNDLYARENQKIIVVNQRGAFHVVRKGENLAKIAKFYNISIAKIKKFNKLGLFHKITPGDILFISEATPKMLTEKINKYYSIRKMFISPVNGKYTSGFGWRTHPVTGKRSFHKGLDIRAKVGTPVYAAKAGTVTYSGPIRGYGNVVIIKHDKTYDTLYAHNSKLFVHVGQKVKQGQIIAKTGRTGRVTGPHLHFEVHKNGKPVNPALYLW